MIDGGCSDEGFYYFRAWLTVQGKDVFLAVLVSKNCSLGSQFLQWDQVRRLTTYYYVRNAQSDIIGLFDKTGAKVVSYTYDSWDKLISIDGSLKDTIGVKNPYRYRGYRYDGETGLYYLNSRYYNAEWGRFVNADALGGKVGDFLSHNVFAYCLNNPINMSDESGYLPKWLKTVRKAVKAFVKSFKLSGGIGAGAGLKGKVKIGKQSLGGSAGGYVERYSFILDRKGGQFGSAIAANASIGVPGGIGAGAEYSAFAPFTINPTLNDPLNDIENQPNSIVDKGY